MDKVYDKHDNPLKGGSAISSGAASSYKGSQKVLGGLWPDGKIYYKIGSFTKNSNSSSPWHKNIYERTKQAISDWNEVNGSYCAFINIEEKSNDYYVTFLQVYGGNPSAHVGCWYGRGQVINLPETYPNGSEVKISCILHEMMHCAGFEHEHSRQDRDLHCTINSTDHNLAANAVNVGSYDYHSLMHYGEVPGMRFNSQELKKLADKSSSFSAGDRAAIKLLYSPKGTHHGEWHKPCEIYCAKNFYNPCSCRNCGLLKGGGVHCGYPRDWKKGHWTCCMSEVEDSKCYTTHTGFWHAQCTSVACKPTICNCTNCGGGCTYWGSRAHWNCCNNENRVSICENDFIKGSTKPY